MIGIARIFTAGGQPTYTYNPREHLCLEEQVCEYLDTRYKILSITGPTKCGKTVLIRAKIPRNQGIWISGGQIHEENDLWNSIINRLNAFTEIDVEDDSFQSSTCGGEVNSGFNLGVIRLGGKASSSNGSSSTTKKRLFAIPCG